MNSIPSWPITVVKVTSPYLLFLAGNPIDLHLWRLKIWYQTCEQKLAQLRFRFYCLCLLIKDGHLIWRMINRLILTLRVLTMLKQSDHTKKTCWYHKKLLNGTEHQNNTEAHCSPVWTSKMRLASVAFGSLQLGSNVFEGVLVFSHQLITLVFMRIKRRDLLHIRAAHIVHVFGVANDIWEAKRHLRRTTTLVLDLVELLSLLRHRNLSLRLFVLFLFLRLLELLERPEQTDLPPFTLLRHGLWTLLQQVNCLTLMFWTGKMSA